jgi:hypothetical protein
MAMSDAALTEIKKEMGYSEDCCSKCLQYKPTDCSGSNSALMEHCSLNAFPVFISANGHCKHFTNKKRV